MPVHWVLLSTTVTVNVGLGLTINDARHARRPTVIAVGATGIHEMTPPRLSESPAGSDPTFRLYVYGPAPPLAVIGWLYTMPGVAGGRVDGESAMEQLPMVIV